jgi:hypothetical protein
MRLLISLKKFNDVETELALKDLEELHKIRGRILHYTTFLEGFLKQKVTKKDYDAYKATCKIRRKFKKLDLNDRILLIIKKFEKLYQKDKDFSQFKKDLNLLRKPYRNDWAHGFVFYKKFILDLTDKNCKPLNFIYNYSKSISIHFKSKYFDKINDVFSRIFYWLNKKKLLKMSGYAIKFLLTNEEKRKISLSFKVRP